MKMPRVIILWVASILLATSPLLADTITVPGDQPTIQSGIMVAQPADTVLVAEGTYFENIDFLGKDIVVCSEYALDLDLTHIYNTIIDGSASADPDTGSCVVFVAGESRAAVLQGFTLTGGTGTSYAFTPTAIYREGGAIIASYSSPTICNNRITGNSAPAGGVALPGGGGGISAMFANPLIRNNVIFKNTASYAAGMVLNYSAGEIRNNIIYDNQGGGQFGTGGLMIWVSPAGSAFVENNIIAGNVSETETGGLSVTDTSAIIRNNIIWGNRQATGAQVTGVATSLMEYNMTEEPLAGLGNQVGYPGFAVSGLRLDASSACIDAGSPIPTDNDVEDPDAPGLALLPSQGDLRCDIGAYGGPFAMALPTDGLDGNFESPTTSLAFGTIDAGQSVSLPIAFRSFSGEPIRFDQVDLYYQFGGNLSVAEDLPWSIDPLHDDTMTIIWQPATSGPLNGVLALHHDCAAVAQNPLLIPFSGTADPVTAVDDLPATIVLQDNYPNPFNPSTTIRFSLPMTARVSLAVYDVHGRRVRTLIAGTKTEGSHEVIWNGTDQSDLPVPSGTYVYRLRTADGERVGRMSLIK